MKCVFTSVHSILSKSKPWLLALLLLPLGALAQGTAYISGTYVDGMSLRDGNLCWKHSLDSDPTTVFRGPILGGQAPALYFTYFAEALRPVSQTAELDGEGNAYWVSADGHVVRQPADGNSTVTPTVVASLENVSFITSSILAVKNTRVFWGEVQGEVGNGGKVFVAPTAGGARTLVINTGLSYPTKITPLSDTEALVLTGDGHFSYCADVGAGGDWYVLGLQSGVDSFAVANGRLYFAVRASSSQVEIRSRALPLDGVATVLHSTVTGSPAPHVRELAADAANLYWHNVVSATGAIMRCPLAGGAGVPIVGAADGDFISLLVSGPWVYWADVDHRTIRRISTAAVPEQIDLAITSVELVQITQTATNSVPLVAGKPTYARIFASIAATNGRTSVSNWPMLEVRAYDPVTNVELDGSPLSPYNGTAVQLGLGGAIASQRFQANGAFLVALPSAWTTRPSVRFTATLNPRHIVAETSYANNVQTVTLPFQRKAPLWLEVVPMSYYGGQTYSSYDPAFEAQIERAESMLPVPAIYTSWRGGPPLRKPVIVFDIPPWELRPINLANGFERGLWGLGGLNAVMLSNDRPAACVAANGSYRAMSFVDPGALGGTTSGMAFLYGLICDFNLSASNAPFNSPQGGETLAHEIAHTLFRFHLPIGGAASPFAGFPGGNTYPYPFTRYNDTGRNALGIDPLTGNPIPEFAAGFAGNPTTAELMGYAFPKWTSDFTINGCLPWLNNLPAGVAVPRSRATRSSSPAPITRLSGGTGEVWMLSAVLSASGNQVNPATQIPDAAMQARLAEQIAAGDTTRYRFMASYADGSSYPIAAIANDDADDTAAASIGLLGCMDADPAVVKISAQAISGGPLLASYLGGGALPSIVSIFPAGGEILSAPFNAQWAASDPEGNTVWTAVRYSHTGGASWLSLALSTPLEKLLIDPALLPGGQDCRLELIASDGIRSKKIISPSFQIPTKAPHPFISIHNAKGSQHGLASVRASAGERIRLEGRALDAEDGIVAEKDLHWTVANGFRTYTGDGPVFEPLALQPGTWAITFNVTDSGGQSATATATLIVEPVFISPTTATIVLDGVPNDDAWLGDLHPQGIRYAATDRRPDATMRMLHSGSTLYVAISGLMRGLNTGEFVGLTFDRNASGDSYPQAGDVRFDIHADGRLVRHAGNGGGYTQLATAGFAARVSVEPGSDSWSIEAAIPDALLGGWSGQLVRMDAVHFHRDYVGDDSHWLGLQVDEWDWPARWAEVVFGISENDPTDSDGNGIADVWEQNYFGYVGVKTDEDPDGDGMTNGAEFAANTIPTKATSRFTSEITTDVSGITLAWPGSLDRTYTVQASSDLTNWTQIAGPIVGVSGGMSRSLPFTPMLPIPGSPASGTKMFYRVSAVSNR